MTRSRILVVEDDPRLMVLTRDLIKEEKLEVQTVASGKDAWELLQKESFELIVLDLGLPDMDGLKLCGQIKEKPGLRETPVFMLTARGSSEDIVLGLEAGAEDYLVKPYNGREFIARLRAILRRKGSAASDTEYLMVEKLKLSASSHEVWCDGKPVVLTLREFDILRVLLSNAGKALTREDIMKLAWGPSAFVVPKVVDVHVGHLRTKLGAEGKKIETVPQVGFKLISSRK